MEVILQWIDLIWAPVVFFIVAKKHRWYAVGFVLSCLMVMRMQYELIAVSGFGTEGIPNFAMDSHPYIRGLVCYSAIFALFIVLSLYSKKTDPIIYMAASISIFFMALISTSVIMSL